MATIPDLTLDAGLPANVDAEKTILGAILLDNAAHAEAAEKLEARRFFARFASPHLPAHERVDRHQRAVDIVTLANELARYKEVESVGGVAYLASLTEGLPRRPVIEEYIRIVKDKSLLRKLMGICSAGHRARRRPERDATRVSSTRPSRNCSRSARRASRRACSRSTRSSATPSAPSTTSTSRAARSPAWPRISTSSTA